MNSFLLIIIAAIGFASVSNAESTSLNDKIIIERMILSQLQSQLSSLKTEHDKLAKAIVTNDARDKNAPKIEVYKKLILEKEIEIRYQNAKLQELVNAEEQELVNAETENSANEAGVRGFTSSRVPRGVRGTPRVIGNLGVTGKGDIIPKIAPKFACGSPTGKLSSDTSNELPLEHCDLQARKFGSADATKAKPTGESPLSREK
ncbi:MAG: hypothetical protein SGI74_13115 [Oligoflexia bacterium]|nr:hypothetical protein [Oligoflexia bacterium]